MAKPRTFVAVSLYIVISIVLLFRYVWYGSLWSDCIYSEENVSIPDWVLNSKIFVAQDAYVAIGKDANYSCMKQIGKVERELVAPSTISDLLVGAGYYTNQGNNIIPINKGTVLTLTNAIAVTKHGISTIDSGSGPIYHLILRDQESRLYRIATVSLGFNEGEYFLSLDNNSTSNNFLSTDSYEVITTMKGEKILNYTGILK